MPFRPYRPRAVTLIEMMVALIVTLIMMAAVATIFGLASGGINNGRAVMDVTDRVRSVQNRLRLDLRGVTAPTYPWLRPEAGYGYFEYQEGDASDKQPLAGADTVYGDTDDILVFTSRSTENLFTDSTGNVSPVAEILWIAVQDTSSSGRPANEPLYNLHRLVAPVRMVAQVNNVLGDLTIRANRNRTMGAFRGGNGALNRTAIETYARSRPETIVMTGIVAFDVRTYDAMAPLIDKGTNAVGPTDPGYSPAASTTRGAWVDLGYQGDSTTLPQKPPFARPPMAPLSGSAPTSPYIWDTAPLIDDYQKTTLSTAPGFFNGVDDISQRQSYQMFPTPLRGVQVLIRVYEPDSRQVRQVTVVEQFLPE